MLWSPCSNPFTWSFYLPPGCCVLAADHSQLPSALGNCPQQTGAICICYQLLPNKSFPKATISIYYAFSEGQECGGYLAIRFWLGSLGRWLSGCQPGYSSLKASGVRIFISQDGSLTRLLAGGLAFLSQWPLHRTAWVSSQHWGLFPSGQAVQERARLNLQGLL